MICILPFEVEFYKRHNINVQFLGHPLVDRIAKYEYISKNELYNKLKLVQNKEILLILPGSRNQEVELIFPEVIEAANKLQIEFGLQIVVACSENISEQRLIEIAPNISFTVAKGNTYDLFKHSIFGIIQGSVDDSPKSFYIEYDVIKSDGTKQKEQFNCVF